MTSILFLTETILPNDVRYYYLRNNRIFLKSSADYWNLHQILNIFRKKDDPHSPRFSEIRNSKKVD